MLVVLLFAMRGLEPVLSQPSPRPALACALAVLAALALAGIALVRHGSATRLVGIAAPLVACALLGVLLACGLSRGVGRAARRLSSVPVSTLVLEVEEDGTKTGSGWWSRASVSDATGRVGEVWLSSDERCPRGCSLRCVGRFVPNDDGRWGEASAAQGVCGTIRLSHEVGRSGASGPLGLVLALRDRLVGAVGPSGSRERALLAGMVCGERSEAKEQGISEEFAATGLAHLIAVSGAHLTIVATFLTTLLGRLRLRPSTRTLALACALGGFVAFCGFPVSAVRAWAMWVVSGLSLFAGRRAHAPSAACAVALAMVVVHPAASGELGYLLSVSCVVALSLFSGYLSYALALVLPARRSSPRLSRPARRLVRPLVASLSSSVVASLVALVVTLPLTLDAFGRVSVVSPLANALVAPLFSLDMLFGLVAVALACVPVAGPVALAAFDLVCHPTLALVDLFAGLPSTQANLPGPGLLGEAAVVAAGAALLAAWPRLTRSASRAALCSAVGVALFLYARWRFASPPRICVLDVGQGDAILVQDGGSAVLVDTGPKGSVAEALAREQVLHLDAVVLTHLHDDHVGGLADLDGRIDVGRVLVAQGVARHESDELVATVREETGGEAQELRYGDVIRVGGFSLRCVWPREEVAGDQNADSLCLVASYSSGGSSLRALLTGDAEGDQLSSVLAAGDVGDVDVLKVGHHGSKASIDQPEAASLDAEVAVASAGKGNDYGHPSAECEGVLEGAGALFLCTIDAGDVTLEPGPRGVRVSCSKDAAQGPPGLP
jgi:competence protein ComEC